MTRRAEVSVYALARRVMALRAEVSVYAPARGVTRP
jgi:hypothetical protein